MYESYRRHGGAKRWRTNVNKIRHADDTVLLANSEEKVQKLVKNNELHVSCGEEA